MRSAAVLALCCHSLAGCTCVAGDYETGCRKGTVRVGDACVAFDACATDEVPTPGGGCDKVGVAACGALGSRDDGGCALDMPVACESGEYFAPGFEAARCVPLDECGSGWPAIDEANFGDKRVYVRPEPGSEPDTYSSIRAALDATTEDPITILVEGTIAESVEIDRKVQLVGRCTEKAIIVPDPIAPNAPPITFVSASEGSTVQHLAVRGGLTGIRVANTGDIHFERVRFHDVRGAALAFDDAQGGGSYIDNCLFEDVGAAVEARGSAVELRTSHVKKATGIAIHAHPSRFAPFTDGYGWDPRASPRSSMSLEKVFVDGAVGTGVLLEGSVGSVSGSIVREVAAGAGTSGARAIAVEWRPTGEVAAELTLKQSALLGPFAVGVDAWNAELVAMEDVVVDGALSPAECPTHSVGVRMRSDESPAVDGSTPAHTLRLERSLISGVADTGVRIEGAAAELAEVLVRDAGQACSSAAGDGVSVESYPYRPASLELLDSRIDRSTRAGVIAFGANLDVHGSLLTCNQYGVVAADGGLTTGTVCGCGESFALCSTLETVLASPLVMGGACTNDATGVCAGWRFGELGDDADEAPLADVAVRVMEPANVRPMLTAANGGVTFEGLGPNQPVRQLATRPGYLARSHAYLTGGQDQAFGWTLNLTPFELLTELGNIGVAEVRQDLSFGIAQIQVCRAAPPEDLSKTGAAYCKPVVGGIAGTTLDIVSLDGIDDPAVVLYTNALDLPDPALEAAQGTYIAMAGIVAGDREFIVRLPEGERLDCTSQLQDTGWRAGWDVKQDPDDWRKVTFRMPIREAQFSAGTYIMCSNAR